MYRAILADDEPLILAGLKCKIDWRASGFEIISECLDGRTLLEAVDKQKPDLILMDIQMPQMTGIEVMRELSTYTHTHIIVISGYSNFSYAQEALRYGAIDYLLKPVSSQALNSAVEKARKLLDRDTQGTSVAWLKNEVDSDANVTDGRNIVLKMQNEMQSNFAQPLTLNDMAEKYHMDKSYLSTLFHKETGKTFTEYLTEIRIRHACEYLTETAFSHWKIASLCGFNSDDYMKRVFRKVLNTTPSLYRKANSNLKSQ